MNKNIPSFLKSAAVALALTAPAAAHAQQVFEVASLGDVSNHALSASIQNFVFDGGTLYVALGGTNTGGGVWDGHQINRVTGIGGTPTVTTLMTSGDWGTGFFSPIHSFQRTGNFLQFGTTGAAAVIGIHRVNVNSGGLITGFNSATILANVPETGLGFLGAGVTDANGEFIFANSNGGNRALYQTSWTSINRLLDQDDLGIIFEGATNQTVNALTLVGDTLFLGSNNANLIATYNLATSASATVLDTATLTGVLGGTGVTLQRMFYAPDGRVYFSTNNRQIASFDPAEPASSLQVDLITGDTPAWNVQALGWYDGYIAFATTSGIYAIPEPRVYAALFGLFALGLVLYRRRR
ncbi:MAG: hypothetical protein JJT96_07595 [Opitutales bacterium]|nr:hypothetical protein [Opitutales bacterium]